MAFKTDFYHIHSVWEVYDIIRAEKEVGAMTIMAKTGVGSEIYGKLARSMRGGLVKRRKVKKPNSNAYVWMYSLKPKAFKFLEEWHLDKFASKKNPHYQKMLKLTEGINRHIDNGGGMVKIKKELDWTD